MLQQQAMHQTHTRSTGPAKTSTFDTDYIMGLSTVDQRMLILIDIEKLMTSQNMAFMDETIH